jgi:hypothetical protein
MTNTTTGANYSGWAVGWAGFAGVMLVMIGMFDVIQGLVALFNDEFIVIAICVAIIWALTAHGRDIAVWRPSPRAPAAPLRRAS